MPSRSSMRSRVEVARSREWANLMRTRAVALLRAHEDKTYSFCDALSSWSA